MSTLNIFIKHRVKGRRENVLATSIKFHKKMFTIIRTLKLANTQENF